MSGYYSGNVDEMRREARDLAEELEALAEGCLYLDEEGSYFIGYDLDDGTEPVDSHDYLAEEVQDCTWRISEPRQNLARDMIDDYMTDYYFC